MNLRPATDADIPALVKIRLTPAVLERWRGDGEDMAASVAQDLADPDIQTFVIVYQDQVAGAIQWGSEDEPDYRHANVDIFVDPALHGRGVGTDAVRTLVRFLINEHGYHRLTIDPAADNAAAIRCYEKAGFRPVGVLRRYERALDGTWHDGLLMDLLADEFVDRRP